MSTIKLEHLVKEYTAGERAVNDVNLEIDDGEFFVLVGPSGCGKSTLLRLLAGLEVPTSGTIEFGGADVTRLAPRDRDIAMVFQNYALYPHMSVAANIGYGLRVRGAKKDELRERVREVAALLGLEQVLDRRPSQLSGGQRQRVAMGRAIARRPQLYLMDEPLSNLDAKLRVVMRAELASLHERLGVTMVYVTHDQVEAMTLGQRAAVLRNGVLQQADAPQVLYRQPANVFVAAFIGSPSMNFVEATLEAGRLRFGAWEVELPERLRPLTGDGTAIVGIRPEAFVPAAQAPADALQVEVKVAVREDLGHETLVFFPIGAPRVATDDIASANRESGGGMEVARTVSADSAVFCARLEAAFPAAVGETLPLAVSPEALLFFDPATGLNVTASVPAPAGTSLS